MSGPRTSSSRAAAETSAPLFEPDEERGRFVDVAVDAPGSAGGQAFTYAVPRSLAELELGEAVVVEFGRRRAVGVVLAEAGEPARPVKPLLARVRSEGPLLGQLARRLARHIGEHYLAPLGIVVRAMLPPGMLERVELVAVAVAEQPAGAGERLGAALAAGGAAGVAVDDLPRATSRAMLLRTLRQLEREGMVRLEWRVRPAGARPRQERWAVISPAGREALRRLAVGEAVGGPPLGPRQRALLEELGAPLGTGAAPAARLGERHGGGTVTSLARRGLVDLHVRTVERRPLSWRAEPPRGSRPHGAALDPDQAAAVAVIGDTIEVGRHATFLLQGDPASGKTTVYAEAAGLALARGRGVLILVPEIALAAPLIDRLRHDLGVDVVMLHSATGEGERADEWRRIASGEARVVVGTRIAVLSPPEPLGLVIVDEEHDPAYKSDRTPRYQARDVAMVLGALAGAPVVLGSATPDIVTLGRVRAGAVRHLGLADRRGETRPNVTLVDMRIELAEGNRGLLSAPLVAALTDLDRAAGDRAILLINRRGSASVVLCRDCGYVQICPECQRPLVFHATVMALRCHHCGASAPVARRCPACGSVRIRYLGGGTERVEQELHVRFPDLRVLRLDRDIVERRGAAARVIDAFTAGEADVLVGTSLVAKGLDIPEVTLVGVVSADIALNLPDERAAERTWQLLTQAVGRAGRGGRPGLALVQTYQPEHPALVAVESGEPDRFVESELERRRRYGSPPYGELIKLTVALPDRDAALKAAETMASALRDRASADARDVAVLGPVPAYVARRGGRWRFHVVLRGRDPRALLSGDPGAPWSVDVDPESLL